MLHYSNREHFKATAPCLPWDAGWWELGLILLAGQLTEAKGCGFVFVVFFSSFQNLEKRQLNPNPNADSHMHVKIYPDC